MKTSLLKKIFFAVAIAIIVIQFLQPAKNISVTISTNAIDQHYSVPKNVSALLKTSCYDCHSNNTLYPWYNNVQPIAWLLSSHVNDGKKDLNFDEFNTYSIERKKKKLTEIIETIDKSEMPLSSYTFIHSKAKLSKSQQKEINSWATALKENLNQ